MASILKRDGPPVRWLVNWREPGTNVQRWKSFCKEGDAKALRDKIGTEIRENTYVASTYVKRARRPFKEFAEDWLARRRGTVSPNSTAQNQWAVHKYLIPAFNQTPLQALTAERIERWQAEMLAAGAKVEARLAAIKKEYEAKRAALAADIEQGGLGKREARKRARALAVQEKTEERAILKEGKPGPRSVEICRTTLGTILKDACDKDKIRKNPVAKVRRFEVPQGELHYLTMEQTKALCERVGRVYGVLFLVMAWCGLRIGEALGLQWPDIDFDRRQVFIRRQVAWRRKKDCKPNEPRWCLVEPKSKAGIRVVEIPDVLAPFLAAHLEAQNGDPNPLALVFPNQEGTPLAPGNIRRRHFRPALKALGVSGIRPHDFRRTFTALHVEAGTHPKLVQERIGHSSIKLTMDLYGKLAGKMPLPTEQVARFNALAAKALPVEAGAAVNTF